MVWSNIIDNCEYQSPRDLYDSNEKYILLNKLICFYQDRNNDEEIVKIIPYILDSPDEYFAVQRFVSYYYYADLDYQIIIYRKNLDYMVNFGLNPWKKFLSRNLGENT